MASCNRGSGFLPILIFPLLSASLIMYISPDSNLLHLIPSNLTPKYHEAILCICSPKQEIANRTLVRLVVLIVLHTGNFLLYTEGRTILPI